MSGPIRVVHYINQFFAGIGGEEANDTPVKVEQGPVGPGRVLQSILASNGQGSVIGTIIVGDNYLADFQEPAVLVIKEAFQRLRPDVVFAGPAFDAGRYGLGCALVCKAASGLGIPGLTAMHPDNPGVLSYGRELIVVPTGSTPSEMRQVLEKMTRLGHKLGTGSQLGSADEEGYLPTGIRRRVFREKPGAERAVDMALARALGSSFVSEISPSQYDPVFAPEAIMDLKEVTLALLTTASLAPRGDPEQQGRSRHAKWFAYSIKGLDALTPDRWECMYGGFKGYVYNTVNPNYALPLPALREVEREGIIKALHTDFFSVAGAGCPVSAARRIGADLAAELRRIGVGALIVEST